MPLPTTRCNSASLRLYYRIKEIQDSILEEKRLFVSDYQDFTKVIKEGMLAYLKTSAHSQQELEGTIFKADLSYTLPEPTAFFYLDQTSVVHSFEERLQVGPSCVVELLARHLESQIKGKVLLIDFNYWKQRYSTDADKEEYFKNTFSKENN